MFPNNPEGVRPFRSEDDLYAQVVRRTAVLRRRRRQLVAGAAGAVAVLLIAVGAAAALTNGGGHHAVRVTGVGPTSTAPAPPPAPAGPLQQDPDYQGDLARQLHYNSGQITLDPPGPNQSANAADPANRPKASYMAAFGHCKNSPPTAACGDGSKRAVMQLAILTDSTYGQQDTVNTMKGPNGQTSPGIKPSFVKKRVWAATWHGVDCFNASGGPPPRPLVAQGTPTTIGSQNTPSEPMAGPPSYAGACDQVTLFDADTGDYLISYEGPTAS